MQVVVIAQGNEQHLQGEFLSNGLLRLYLSDHLFPDLNSQMRRIDLFCKLIGPLAIALVDGFSTRVAILVTFAMTCMSAGVEYFAIAKVKLYSRLLCTSSHSDMS